MKSSPSVLFLLDAHFFNQLILFFCFGSSFCVRLVLPTTSDLLSVRQVKLEGSSLEPVDLVVPSFCGRLKFRCFFFFLSFCFFVFVLFRFFTCPVVEGHSMFGALRYFRLSCRLTSPRPAGTQGFWSGSCFCYGTA